MAAAGQKQQIGTHLIDYTIERQGMCGMTDENLYKYENIQNRIIIMEYEKFITCDNVEKREYSIHICIHVRTKKTEPMRRTNGYHVRYSEAISSLNIAFDTTFFFTPVVRKLFLKFGFCRFLTPQESEKVGMQGR